MENPIWNASSNPKEISIFCTFMDNLVWFAISVCKDPFFQTFCEKAQQKAHRVTLWSGMEKDTIVYGILRHFEKPDLTFFAFLALCRKKRKMMMTFWSSKYTRFLYTKLLTIISDKGEKSFLLWKPCANCTWNNQVAKGLFRSLRCTKLLVKHENVENFICFSLFFMVSQHFMVVTHFDSLWPTKNTKRVVDNLVHSVHTHQHFGLMKIGSFGRWDSWFVWIVNLQTFWELSLSLLEEESQEVLALKLQLLF